MSAPEPDYKASKAFLDQWLPGGPWVLVAIDPNKKGIEADTFSVGVNDTKQLNDWLTEQGTTKRRNIYFTVNQCDRPLKTKPSREHIAALSWLHIDLDPRAGEDLDEERERILTLLQDPTPLGVPKPTAIVFSGGGYQAFWRLEGKSCLFLNGKAEMFEDAKRWNKQLELTLGGDNCHNVDRIMRLPGSINRPDKRKREKGRVEVLAEVVEFNDTAHDIAKFTKAPAAPVQGSSAPGFSGGTVTVSGNIARYSTVDEIEELKPEEYNQCRVVIVQGHDPDEPDKFGASRSEWLFFVCCDMVRAGCDADAIYSVITDPDFGVSASVLDKGSGTEDYAVRQIERAQEEAVDPILREFNDEFALTVVGGKSRVLREFEGSTGVRTVEFWLRDAFTSIANKRSVEYVNEDDKVVSKPAGTWWLAHPLGRAYREVTYAPEAVVPGAYNLWQGFAFEPDPGGDCSIYLDHLRRNVCRKVEAHYEYLLNWMAYAVQNPNEQGHVAVAMRGEKGTGKDVAADEFGALWGTHYVAIANAKHLVGFNSMITACSVLFLNEAVKPKEAAHEAVLKSAVTGHTIIVEGKGVDAVTRKNVLHLIIASNDLSFIKATGDERRYFALELGDGNRRDGDFFGRLKRQMDDGGRAKLLHILLTRDLSEFDVRAVPETGVLHDQVSRNLEPEDQWLLTLLTDGCLPNNVDRKQGSYQGPMTSRAWWGESVADARDGLRHHADATVPKLRFTSDHSLGYFLDGWGIVSPEKGGRRSRVFPPLAELRTAWCKRHGPRDWPSAGEWIVADEPPILYPEVG